MYLCIYVSMYLCIYVYMYICIYVYMYICIYVCLYIYMYDYLGLKLLYGTPLRPKYMLLGVCENRGPLM